MAPESSDPLEIMEAHFLDSTVGIHVGDPY
jgi:hypothetical protein